MTVALSGDGGDELLGAIIGIFGAKIWQYFEHVPFKVRYLMAIIAKNTATVFEVLANSYNRFVPDEKQIIHLADKVQRLGTRLSARAPMICIGLWLANGPLI